jgi:putative transposase
MTDAEMMNRIHQECLNVVVSCQIFELNRSSYYEQIHRPISRSERRRQELSSHIRSIYDEFEQIYGAPKVYDELLSRGVSVGKKLVQKLMKEMGVKAVCVKKFKPASSKSDHVSRENLVTTEPTKINQVWSTDITYIQTQAHGWVYLSTIMDRYSKKIIAWEIDRRMTAGLVMRTIQKAMECRGVSEELILHSDQGSQYTSKEYNELLEKHEIRHSYSRKGYPYHNASLESWHGHLKREWIYRFVLKDFQEAKHKVFWYIESFYNQKRSHQSLNYLTPNQFEAQQQNLAA